MTHLLSTQAMQLSGFRDLTYAASVSAFMCLNIHKTSTKMREWIMNDSNIGIKVASPFKKFPEQKRWHSHSFIITGATVGKRFLLLRLTNNHLIFNLNKQIKNQYMKCYSLSLSCDIYLYKGNFATLKLTGIKLKHFFFVSVLSSNIRNSK